MSRNAPRISGLLGVVHRVADEWRVLVVDSAGGTPRVVTSETVPAAAPDRVESLLESAKVDHCLQVVPASASVCRTCTLPDADGEALQAALGLQAETWLLAGTPDHRFGAGVLPKAAAETSRTGVVVSWPESAATDVAPTPTEARWVPEPVALAALLHDQRPAEPLITVDRQRGAAALVICDPGGVTIRSTHVDLEGEWQPRLTAMIVETALGGDHTPAFARRAADDVIAGLGQLPSDGAACQLPGAVVEHARRRLRDSGGDGTWWNTFGVAAGAALAALGEFADAAALEEAARVEEESTLTRLADAIARPRTAVMIAAACLLFLAVLPLLTSGLRRAVLQARHGDVSTLASQVTDARARLAMYDELEGRSWPMTKLLGDIASSTPEGITLTNLTVSLDQQTFSIRGEALGRNGEDATQRVLLMQRQLGETDGLFSSVTIDWDRQNNFGAYGFTIAADIPSPFARPEYEIERDFGRWTAWMRQRNMPPPSDDEAAAGDDGVSTSVPDDALADAGSSTGGVGASGTPRIDRPSGGSSNRGSASDDRDGVDRSSTTPNVGEIPRADGDRPSSSRPDRGPRERIGSSGSAVEAGSSESRTGNAAGGGDIPEPLTQSQIDGMQRAEVLEYMRRVGSARNRFRGVEGQEELSNRLNSEWDLLKARLTELSQSGGGS